MGEAGGGNPSDQHRPIPPNAVSMRVCGLLSRKQGRGDDYQETSHVAFAANACQLGAAIEHHQMS